MARVAVESGITSRDRFMALTKFHWAAGARVALRANAMVLGTVIFIFGSAPEALATLRHFLLGIVGVGDLSGPRMLLAVIAAGFAGTAVRRVMLGANGWMRALPIGSRAAWRAGVAALCMAQLAVVTFIPLAVLMAAMVYRRPIEWAKVASLFLMIPAVSATVLPSRRMYTRATAAVALAFTIIGTWGASLGCIAILSFADALSPSIGSVRRASAPRSAMPRRSSPTAIWMRASWRAMRFGGIAAAGALPVILGSYAHFMARNNPGITAATVATATRVSGALAIAAFSATLANTLLRTRQPWPWARSLPWSSMQRVAADALVLGLPMVVVPLGLWPVSGVSALVVACLLPLGAASGATALRRATRRQTGAAGETTLVMLIAGTAIALSPWLALPTLGATPFVLRLGARRDREEVATRWSELHHDASGDPAWLTRA